MTGLQVILDDSAEVVLKKLEALPAGSEVVAIYGLNGRHVAWVKGPRQSQNKYPKKGN